MTAVIDPQAELDTPLLQDNVQLIGGEWVPAASGETIEVINPANRQLLARIPRGTADDVDAAVKAAEQALPAWRDLNATARASLLYRWATLVEENAEVLDQLESRDVGRPHWGPSPVPGMLRFIAGQADKVHGVSLPTYSPDVMGFTVREPFGVVGAIIPWNAPGPMFTNEVAASIAAGNTIVIKPAEDAPLAPLALAKLAMDAGIPAGVVNVVTGYGSEAGAAIPSHPGIRRVGFTGSPATGSIVMEACARNLIPLHLELGGKSPQVVFPDANLSAAAPAIAAGITMNTGQICAAGSRVVVHRSVHQEMVERLAEAMQKVTVGPWHQQVNMGPLINGRQHERVMGYIEAGKSGGADLVLGGGVPSGEAFGDGFFVNPTLFDNVKPDMKIAQEEIFGPVLSVIPVDNEEEAVAVANGVDYGLVASVWTEDVGTAVRMSRALEAGQVGVNNALGAGVIGGPFGGYKSSGFGRTMGADAVQNWTQVKTISMRGATRPGN
ncbi:aldehyde dehydrogenase family protein [Citricoccus sp. GCM10030269]|uniref:aldehyde dehydrogenase family protein n=1 Tax=Citricoccus sp. GCM10030269 TaxID=3273388 RepID=UPI0036066700